MREIAPPSNKYNIAEIQYKITNKCYYQVATGELPEYSCIRDKAAVVRGVERCLSEFCMVWSTARLLETRASPETRRDFLFHLKALLEHSPARERHEVGIAGGEGGAERASEAGRGRGVLMVCVCVRVCEVEPEPVWSLTMRAPRERKRGITEAARGRGRRWNIIEFFSGYGMCVLSVYFDVRLAAAVPRYLAK